MRQDLVMWVIYKRQDGHPQPFVAKKWFASEGQTIPTEEYRYARTLAEIREAIPQGLVCFARDVTDEPQIVETWL